MRVFFLAFLFLVGCRSPEIITVTKELRIRDTIIRVLPPPIDLSVPTYQTPEYIGGVALSADGRDTVVKVRYYPKIDTMKIYVQPPVVQHTYTDTTAYNQTTEIKEEEGSPWYLYMIAFILFAFAYYQFREMKKCQIK